jgi:hypothetical protein
MHYCPKYIFDHKIAIPSNKEKCAIMVLAMLMAIYCHFFFKKQNQ